MNPFMKAALMAGMESLQSGHGGPFGAAVVRDGKIVAVSGNRVYETQDPTMHAEVAAIRLAAERLGTRAPPIGPKSPAYAMAAAGRTPL